MMPIFLAFGRATADPNDPDDPLNNDTDNLFKLSSMYFDGGL